MKQITFYLLCVMLLASCVKQEGVSKADNNNFNYTTVKEVAVGSITKAAVGVSYDVFDQDGSLIAKNVPEDVALTVAQNAKLTIKETTTYSNEAVVYFPAADEFATMWFEDLFPSRGDYDMNDAAIGFRYEFILDKEWLTVMQMRVTVDPRAIGSSFTKIGLALNFTNMPVFVSSVQRSADCNLASLFTVNQGGVETPLSSAGVVLPLTGSLRNHFTTNSNGYVNVQRGQPNNPGVPFTIDIAFEKGLQYSDITLFGTNPQRKYNIDLFACFDTRGREVHVKGMAPTAQFDLNYFKQVGRSDFADKGNFIWALMVPRAVSHPVEKANVTRSYPEFGEWVTSSGAVNQNWYDTKIEELCYDHKY